MQYEKYYQKALKVANVLTVLRRLRVPIIITALAIVMALSAFFALYGFSYQSGECPPQITYGETINYEAKALFTTVTYEYCTISTGTAEEENQKTTVKNTVASSAESEVWTTEMPKSVGTYKVRSVSVSIFGTTRYGSEFTFSILPKEITVSIQGESVQYGDLPAVSASLGFTDEVECTNFIYEDVTAEATNVTPDKDCVNIYNSNGETVTQNYTISCETSYISIVNRKITLTADDDSKVYDGTALECGGYSITGGSLAYEDNISNATLCGSIVSVGEAASTVKDISIVNSDGTDVTCKYDITVNDGTLQVEKREVTVITSDSEWVYDGQEHFNESFDISESSPYGIAANQTAQVISNTVVKTVTEGAANALTLAVYDSDGNDVTENYEITYEIGLLVVTPRKITFLTGGGEWVYDGQDHYSEDFEVSENSENTVAAGQTAKVTSNTAVKTVTDGTENALTIAIYDGTEEVTGNYEITYENGTLIITPRPVTFTTSDGEWTYDGQEHYNESFEVSANSENNIVEGHTAKATSNTVVKTVTEGTANALEIAIYEGEDDVTGNYLITYENGSLTVLHRSVTLTTADGEWVYDGQEHFNEDFNVSANSENQIAQGHTAQVTSNTKVKTVTAGTANALVIAIYDGTEDVSANYSIAYENGTLIITPRPVTITAGSAEKVYDAAALTCTEISADNLAAAHTAGATTYGSQTVVGSSANAVQVGSVTICDENGVNVTANYEISYAEGALTVTPRPVIIVTGSGEWVYDGQAHFNEDFNVSENSEYTIVESHTAKVTSYTVVKTVAEGTQNALTIAIYEGADDVTGNYEITYENGTLIITPRPVTFTTGSGEWVYDGEEHYNEYYALSENSTYALVSGQVSLVTGKTIVYNVTDGTENGLIIAVYEGTENVTGNYEITYECGTLVITPRPVTIITGSEEWVYDGTEHYNDDISLSPDSAYEIVQSHTAQVTERTYVKTVTEGTENALIVVIYDGDGNIVTGNYDISFENGTLVVTRRAITVKTYDYEWVYDGEEHYYDVVTASGMVEWHAVYTVEKTVVTDVTDGTENVLEIAIYDGEEEVTDNYLITYDNGTLTVTRRPIIIIACDAEKIYDATPLTCGDTTGDNLVLDHYTVAQTEGSRTNVGTSVNVVVQGTAVIYDGAGNDISYNYEIIGYAEGTLTVYPRPITIKADDAEKIYDGTPLTCETYSVTSVYDVVAWHTLYAQTYGSQTDAGTGINYMQENAVIYDENGEDVTYNYEITYAQGTLTVLPRPITLTTGSGEWVYDGQEHYNDGFALSENSAYDILSWQMPVVTYYTTVKTVTTGTANELGIAIYDGERDVTFNYEITYECGTLIITPRPVTFTTGSGEWVYDGEEHRNEEYALSENSEYQLVDGHTTWLSISFCFVNVTTGTENRLTIEIHDGDENVSDNYDISYEYGILIINPRPVIIVTGGGEWVYDGEEHYNEYCYVSENSAYGLVTGHSIQVTDYTVVKTVTAGTDNKIEIAIYDGYGTDLTKNYKISYELGTLIITPRPVTFTTGSGEWIYDGEEHYNGYYALSENSAYQLVEGHTANLTSYTTVKKVTDGTANALIIKIYDEGGNDLTKNYDITYECGSLVVLVREITIQTADGNKLYDGLSLTDNGYAVIEGSVVVNQLVVASESLSIKDIGSAINEFTIRIYDVSSEDVTDNYSITYVYGILTVFSPLYFGTDSGYESVKFITTVANGSYTYTYIAEATGYYTFTVESGSQVIFKSESENSALYGGKSMILTDSSSQSFTVQLDEGDEILISGKSGSIVTAEYNKEDSSGSGSSGGSASDLNTSGKISGGSTGGGDDAVSFTIYSDESGSLYLKLMSFGDYNGSGWDKATEYDGYIVINGTNYSLNYLMSIALQEAGYSSSDVVITLYINDYLIPYYTSVSGGDYTVQTSDTSYSGTGATYSLNVYYYDYLEYSGTGLSLSEIYAEYEALYRQFVYANYLSVPDSTLAYLNTIISAQGFSKTDKDIVSKVASYIQNAATYNLEYDRGLDDEADIVVAFLSTYKEGICQHYASAATLLFRALGIPSRYVIGYFAITSAGETVEVTPATAHAWTEVYIDGLGWVNVEVTGGGTVSGMIAGEAEKKTITIKPADVTEQYKDGIIISASAVVGYSDNDKLQLYELLSLGYTYYVEFEGTLSKIGTATSSITKFVLYDPDGNKCDDYIIELEEGTLTLTANIVVTVYLYSVSKEYDGTPIGYEDEDYYYEISEEGYTFVLYNLSSITLTNSGVIDVDKLKALSYSVFDTYGNDIAEYVTVAFDEQELLAVMPRALTVTSGSSTKEYDGKALTNDNWWISFGTLAEGHTIEVTITGTITFAGEEQNEFTVKIYDKEGNDVTENYNIEYNYGTLLVTEEEE